LSGNPPFVNRGTNSGGVFLGLAATLTSRLNLGINDGDVRVLASPELTARSGGKARLQVGGEVPIQQAGALGTTNVTYKPYGIILEIEPQIDANNVITAKISSELSQLDPSVTAAAAPGFLTRNTSTEVSLRSGEVVALSGLVNSEMSSAVDRVPVLSKIPILGGLFRSEDFRRNKTELVVLLEPEIIEPGAGLAMQLRQRGEANKKAFEDKLSAEPRLPTEAPRPLETARKPYETRLLKQ
jgi:pilus assembly protein CpaC